MNEISSSARISPLADIEVSSRGSSLIVGNESVIDSFVKIKFVGGGGDIQIGNNSYINAGCVIYSGNGVKIGDDVLVAANCTFAASNHEFSAVDKPIRLQRFKPSRGGIIIEDDVWIGANVVLLDGAIIRRGAVVAAGAVVSSVVEPFTVVGGSPLRVLKKRGGQP